ncbi:MAG: dihydrolipoyl dehydrogenase [Firmicutes bacterium]|nr:dihydrolipoyl dehydrogenase [Bacillota bacterium]
MHVAQYDIAVLGGGPGGYVAAIRAAQRGARTVLIEKETLGGVCLNVGCIPTKTLLRSAQVYQEVIDAAQFGIIVDGKVKLDWPSILSRKDKVVKQLTGGVTQLLKANGVDVKHGYGLVRDKNTIVVDDEEIQTKNLIIATGSRPAILPIPGLQDAIDRGLAIDSTGALQLQEVPERFVVVGGGVIGIEFAALFSTLGSKVTVLEKFSILNGLDADIQAHMRRFLKRRGVEIYENADVQRFDGSRVVVDIGAEVREFEGDAVLVSLGRRPNIDAVSSLGLELDRGGIKTNDRLETNISGVYAIGDVNGKQMLAHTASAEGIAAVENILGGSAEIDYDKIPACVYSFPEIAVVGLTEEQAESRGHDVQTGMFPFAANGKALAEGQTEGFVKIVADKKYGEVLGIHIIGPHATDLIAEAANALRLESTLYDLAETVHPHPTLSEAVMEAAHVALGQPIHVAR